MAVARRGTGRFLVPFAQQAAFSIAGTLISTVLITGFQHASPPGRSAVIAAPELTSGGKFAARAEAPADDGNGEAFALLSLPALPLLRAAGVLSSDGMSTGLGAVAAAALGSDKKPPVEPAKSHHLVRSEARRHFAADLHVVVPPRRADFIETQVAAAGEVGSATLLQAAESGGLWGDTKAVITRAAGYGGMLWDRLTP